VRAIGRRDAGIDSHHHDLAALGVQLLDGIERRRATRPTFVAGDSRTTAKDGSFVVVSTSTTFDIPAAAGLLEGLLHGLHVGRCDQQCVGPCLGDDRVDDGLLQRRVELSLRGPGC